MPDLFEGGRYIQERGFSTREIEAIHGDDIHWRDKFGAGQCSRQSFGRWLGRGSLAPDSPQSPQRVVRCSKITVQAIEQVHSDAAMLQKLKELSIKPEMDSQGLAAICLWAMRSSITRIQEQAEYVPTGKRLRAFTRIDENAQMVRPRSLPFATG